MNVLWFLEVVMTLKCTSYGGFKFCHEMPEEKPGKLHLTLNWHQVWTTLAMLLFLIALFLVL